MFDFCPLLSVCYANDNTVTRWEIQQGSSCYCGWWQHLYSALILPMGCTYIIDVTPCYQYVRCCPGSKSSEILFLFLNQGKVMESKSNYTAVTCTLGGQVVSYGLIKDKWRCMFLIPESKSYLYFMSRSLGFNSVQAESSETPSLCSTVQALQR